MEKKSIKNEEMARRVRNEVALHRKLRHPNILNLYHFFEDDDRVYLVMELCSRGEIYSLLRRRRQENGGAAGVLSENEARGILRDVVAGLKFLHSRGIIHRDLKLSNILLSESGEAKIADFGLAVGTTTNDFGDSQERTICGTPNYLAPEILNKLNYGRAADIWSLGCLLYSFLTGKPPFDSPDLKETFTRVKSLDYQIPAGVSASATDLITRLLAKDPETRPTFDQIIWHPFFNPAVNDPLTTLRLAPLKQSTKYGLVEIGADGRVLVDFLDSESFTLISNDGLRIESINKTTTTNKTVNTFNIVNIPPPLKRQYEYARRFVNLVKAKTPLIILNTRNLKAFLAESGDFYMTFKNGFRAEFCWVSRQLRIFPTEQQSSNALIINDPSPLALSEIDSETHRQLLLEFLARYRQSLHIKNSILHSDGTQRSRYKNSQFPFIIKEDEEDYEKKGMCHNNSHISNTSNNSNLFPHHQSRKYLPNIGWCISSPSINPNSSSSTEHHIFLVLFNDGRAIQIDGHSDTLLDLQTNKSFPINHLLPQEMKEMLALFSKFL